MSDTGLSKNSGKMGKDCGMDGSDGNLEQVLIEKCEEKEDNIEII